MIGAHNLRAAPGVVVAVVTFSFLVYLSALGSDPLQAVVIQEGHEDQARRSRSWLASDEHRDLRLLVSTAASLEKRTRARQVLVVRSMGSVHSVAFEVPVPKPATVAECLSAVGMTRAAGSKPQVRVVTRNEVFQTPLPGAGGAALDEQRCRVLDRRVDAGDVVCVLLLQE
jgi:hypothetical protein